MVSVVMVSMAFLSWPLRYLAMDRANVLLPELELPMNITVHISLSPLCSAASVSRECKARVTAESVMGEKMVSNRGDSTIKSGLTTKCGSLENDPL